MTQAASEVGGQSVRVSALAEARVLGEVHRSPGVVREKILVGPLVAPGRRVVDPVVPTSSTFEYDEVRAAYPDDGRHLQPGELLERIANMTFTRQAKISCGIDEVARCRPVT